ncbi:MULTISPECIES: sulfite exporter TauE/SafE family protein [unclassified Pseudomonas]|uniref:sulfite exporter TauE/SafE family protein n=1 Tax=unclassified Pseudomonas TaxID=196821 RepID=UPI002AC93C0C|nr:MULTISPECIES: sulfite exporter TauE/SafE family protein [unclassified Pseudomonas]MEB0040794.1 sulfite exporter TauE/SafE family protein [Pseudomonas sp. MH10]MEB0076291.1 sulfite exporter TauE/SafE family protein [Pseudomonas sp. MH10out]MEB0093707.1 sulfite exporter TauE/SafE family protein [Pseudomonas sp. CCI4.2]MEB0101070.1 sulfite exporter TauE/SafE family protein [Pseudomonas sp. CCI3.2]MEB0122963.1 sulfite exporter TauE/SafE family protein [Pseudomonas sp. CCI1.2]
MSLLILAAFGCLTGVTTVLFGFGGGFVVVPLVYHVLISGHSPGEPGYDSAMQIAVATSTAVMVISASMATFKQHRAAKLVHGYIWPLVGYIALGSVAGALLASAMSSNGVRIAFMVYLGLTIADCLFREGFLQSAGHTKRTVPAIPIKGVTIGTVATLLGVGGSVMTVPLMRRAGLSMAQSSALANPLSMPVALIGSLMYAVTGQLETAGINSGFLGYIYLPAFGLLTVGSLIGVRLTLPFAGRIPDKLHAHIYVALLILVLLALGIS